jgi:hypothetical protein
VLFVHQLVGARSDRSHGLRGGQAVGPGRAVPGPDAALQPRHAHHEELVQVGAENGEELHALEQWDARIPGLFEHATIELEPGQLAIDEGLNVHAIAAG